MATGLAIQMNSAAAATTTRVSMDSNGNETSGFNDWPSISGNGSVVAFRSDASNLVIDDFNGQSDIFVHDRQTGQTRRVSVDSTGGEASG
jgi:Tol biopolymer transport system component